MEVSIGLAFQIIGVVIAIAAIAGGFVLQSAFDVRNIVTPNEFLNSFLHSEAVVPLVEQAKYYIALGITALGFCSGLICFGIGLILSRLRKLSQQIEKYAAPHGA